MLVKICLQIGFERTQNHLYIKKNPEQSQINNSKKDLKMKFYQNLQLQTL